MLDIYEPVLQKTRTINYDGPTTVHSAVDAYEILRAYGLPNKTEEHIIMLAFNNEMSLLGICEVAAGTVESCETSPREIFKRAIMFNASGIVIAHNHFSKGTCPTDGDIVLTKAIMDAAEVIGISLLDHIIVGLDGEWTSMLETEYLDDIRKGECDDIVRVFARETPGALALGSSLEFKCDERK